MKITIMSSTYWGKGLNKMAVKEKEDNIIATIWLVNNFLENEAGPLEEKIIFQPQIIVESADTYFAAIEVGA